MQKIETVVLDDIDGSAAETTIRFGLDGADYEIDLNAAHASTFRDAMRRYVQAGRRVSAGQRRPGTRPRRASVGPDAAEVREWAQKEGVPVRERGRVPNEVIAKFRAANGS